MMGIVQDVPTPQAPPFPDPNIVIQSQEQFLIGLAIVVISIAAVFILRPLFAAFARRLEGKSIDASLRGDVEHLREQIAEVEPLRTRMLELEERLEFTERLLAERRDQDLLRRGGDER
jgi:hypothetical protein